MEQDAGVRLGQIEEEIRRVKALQVEEGTNKTVTARFWP